MFAESNRAVINHYHRFAIFAPATGKPKETGRLLIRNTKGQLVAKTMCDRQGWAFADIPLFENDTLFFFNEHAELLATHAAAQLVSDTGFALKSAFDGPNLITEMRKAPHEKRNQVILKLYYRHKMLYEAMAQFRQDTMVVETLLPLQGLQQKLLKLELTDTNGEVLNSKWVYLAGNGKKTGSLPADVQFHHLHSCIAAADIAEKTINDYLIAAPVLFVPATDSLLTGIPFYFEAPGLAAQSIHYQITDTLQKIMDIGTVQVDSLDMIRIPNQTFSGRAKITFFLKGNQSLAAIAPVSAAKVAPYRNALLAAYSNMSVARGLDADGQNNAYRGGDTVALLQGVEVTGQRKSRNAILQEKYISNGMFKETNALDFDLENDPYTSNYDIYDYLMRKVPGLSVKPDPADPRQKIFVYRQGTVEVYLDETFIGSAKDLPFKTLVDIGYIRFLRQPVSAMRNAAGGSIIRQNGYLAGITATISLYTIKTGNKTPAAAAKQEFWLQGYSN